MGKTRSNGEKLFVMVPRKEIWSLGIEDFGNRNLVSGRSQQYV
jgi:hypothetical protein